MVTINFPALEESQGQPAALASQLGVVLPGSFQLLQASHVADTLRMPNQLSLVPTRRLVVLVPAGEVDEQALVRRVWQLAAPTGLDVLYLTLCSDATQVAYQRRRLAGLAALSADPLVRTDIAIRTEKNWSQALTHILKSGELLVCLAAEVHPGPFRHETVGKWLAACLNVPVYEFGDLEVKPTPTHQSWRNKVIGWTASTVSVAAFYWLQLGINHPTAGPQSTILLCLPILAELLILWKINHWIG